MVMKNLGDKEDVEKKLSPQLVTDGSDGRRAIAMNLLSCDYYDHEYRQCSSFSGRIDNYYRGISISREECARFRELFNDCANYERDPVNNFQALLRLNDYENELMRRRLETTKANDVWERRTKPPSDWNSPLPDWCMEKLKSTSWYKSNSSASN